MHKKEKVTPVQIINDTSDVLLTNLHINSFVVSSKTRILQIDETTIDNIDFSNASLIEKIVINNSQVSGNLDLRRIQNITSVEIIDSNIRNILLNSRDIVTLIIDRSHISEDISLTGCTISSEVCICNSHICGSIKLDSASIMSKYGLKCLDNTIEGDLDLSDIVVNGLADMSNSQINNLLANDFESRNGGFSLSSCTLNGNILLRHAVIDGIADFSGITVFGNADMKYSMFNGLFDAAYSRWFGDIDLSFYSKEISGKRLQFRAGVHFDNSKIDGDLICNDIVNCGEMLFIDIKVAGIFELTNSSISGVTIFQRATFSGLANLSGSRFLSRLLFDSIVVDSFQMDRTYHNDKVAVNSSIIHNNFHSLESKYISGFIIQSTQFNGKFSLYGSLFSKDLIIKRSKFKSEFDIRELNTPIEINLIEISDSQFSSNTNFSNTNLTAKKLLVKDCFFERKFLWRYSYLNISEISFINIEFTSLVDFRGTDFTIPNCLSFIRVSSENVLLTKDQLQNALYVTKSKGDFRERAWRHDRNADSFHWTKDVFAGNRRYADQDWAIYNYLKEDALKKVCLGFVKPLKIAKLLKAIFVDYLGIYLFWRLACGFGLRLRYMLFSSVLIVGMFGFLFSINPNEMIISDEVYNTLVCENQVVLSEEEINFPVQNYQSSYTATLRHSMKFSASVFTSMTSGATFMKINSSFGFFVIIEGLLGVLFTTLFIGSAIRKVIRTV